MSDKGLHVMGNLGEIVFLSNEAMQLVRELKEQVEALELENTSLRDELNAARIQLVEFERAA